MKNPYTKAEFLLSVANLKQLPADHGIEVAFVGRSNAGKSSVLNQLTQNKRLARVSNTPGRTQHINLFKIDDERRFADLPGYGYAKVPPDVKQKWQHLLDSYLRQRECLKGVILIMDIRHPLKEFDQHMIEWSAASNLSVHVVLNKMDKLKRSAINLASLQVKKFLQDYPNYTLQTFSALTGAGLDDLKSLLDSWFNFN